MDLLTTLVFLRRGSKGVCLSEIFLRRKIETYFLFLDFWNIFPNYLKTYVYVYFCVCLFNFWDYFLLYFRYIIWDIIKIWKEYVSYMKLTSSKVLKKYRKSSLCFFIRLPFQFLETFFVTSPRYCQDVSFERYIDLCNFKLKEESDILFRSVFLALSNSFLSYNIWNCIIFLRIMFSQSIQIFRKYQKDFHESFVSFS